MHSFSLDPVCHSSLSKRVGKGLKSLRSRLITSDSCGALVARVSSWEKITETLWLSTSFRFLPALGEWVKKGQKYCQIRRKEWLESDWTFDDPVQPPCYGQRHLPLNQADPSAVQPGLEHFQKWGTHSFSGKMWLLYWKQTEAVDLLSLQDKHGTKPAWKNFPPIAPQGWWILSHELQSD